MLKKIDLFAIAGQGIKLCSQKELGNEEIKYGTQTWRVYSVSEKDKIKSSRFISQNLQYKEVREFLFLEELVEEGTGPRSSQVKVLLSRLIVLKSMG